MTTETQFDDTVQVEAPVLTLAEEVKELVRGELVNFLTDVEFRLSQTAEINRRTLTLLDSLGAPVRSLPISDGSVYAEDLNILQHQLTGYTVSSNSPSAGSIAWTSLHVVYNGTDYSLTNGNTALKYAWFDAAVSTTVVQTSNTKPTLSGNACLLFFNDAGVVREVLNATIPPVVGNSSVDTAAIQAGAVGPTQTSFYSTLTTAITAAQSAADIAQATADGAIVTYFQPARPWADGTTQPVGVVGDIWYDSASGAAYRWSGAAGSPANTWVLIPDTQATAAIAAAAAAQSTANSKITTFYANLSSPPTATTVGDLWVVIDQGNLLKRASATGTGSWVDLQVGTAAIATNAVTDAKIAPGIGGGKITAGTVSATQLGAGAVTPVKLNVLQHVLY